MRLIFRLPNNQKSGMPMSGNSKIVISQVRLLAGERRCLTIVDTTSSASGINKMPTATTVPAIANAKDQGELVIQFMPPIELGRRKASSAIEINCKLHLTMSAPPPETQIILRTV